MEVITYQLAYLRGEVSLCAKHDNCQDYGTLGPVSHGRHESICDACSDAAIKEERV